MSETDNHRWALREERTPSFQCAVTGYRWPLRPRALRKVHNRFRAVLDGRGGFVREADDE